jgi:hypothetical protein
MAASAARVTSQFDSTLMRSKGSSSASGCTEGACHGASRGQGDFDLRRERLREPARDPVPGSAELRITRAVRVALALWRSSPPPPRRAASPSRHPPNGLPPISEDEPGRALVDRRRTPRTGWSPACKIGSTRLRIRRRSRSSRSRRRHPTVCSSACRSTPSSPQTEVCFAQYFDLQRTGSAGVPHAGRKVGLHERLRNAAGSVTAITYR